MAKNGIKYPGVIDFVTSKDDVCGLYIIQVDRVDDREIQALQEKINNYLTFALDGQLTSEYPSMAGKQVKIYMQLSCDPTTLQQDFYTNVTAVCNKEGIGFEVEIPDYLRELEQKYPTQGKSEKPWWRFW